ncbi:aspartate carbamoyltransferase catalytic subunit [Legionella micdadei]|uniref:Aspartate carbamoyltransferase n=1 Tax=Legionella micdadei TaxID=451 RepID=A0A098GH51_LEGMI|nr:aspartate carbamoyltransferase catalytic subunit [Legionella micdadei]ARG96797.1 aspartate carbamoyltransferase [Legionella micdadei]ARG99529.1 aspartate carbamoyltransferase [Legionella micdadei]KTD26469.1 aspartate carbamoyltransferase [Legionella micdadei]NSL17940.1 aspartate carbamoyltransferase catalytic subunit [Legionella micdadei]CEG61813.1 Aspartate carbamoyltransferase [Legionella micdadei]
MKHFLEISQLSDKQINSLLQSALSFKNSHQYPSYPQHTVANLFYENSTRTRVSFEIAAKKLSMMAINLNLQGSSETKGEAIEDTIRTLSAMGIDLFVIRHRQDGLQNTLAEKLTQGIHIVNAGDGQHAHPSQAMLDLMTIVEKKPNLTQLKLAIIGNIRHSRVANSLQCLCATVGIGELVLVAPPIWQPQQIHYGRVTHSLREGLADADVVICLRVQHERLQENEQMDLTTYRREYALTRETIRFAKPDAIIMHPGPMNRGVEIDSDVADGPQSCILQQVTNGVFMRMAILESLIM